MTTDKYLKRLSWLANMITSRSEKIELGMARATNMVVPTDNTPVQSSPKDTLCEIMSDLVDTDEEKRVYVTEYRFIMGQVNSLTGVYSPAYLFRRYVRGQSMNEIASEMHISRSTAYRIHREALDEFEELYGETYKTTNKFSMLEHFETY